MENTMENSKYWVRLDPRLEDEIGTEMFDDIRVYLEFELREYLRLKLPRIVLKAKHDPVDEQEQRFLRKRTEEIINSPIWSYLRELYPTKLQRRLAYKLGITRE